MSDNGSEDGQRRYERYSKLTDVGGYVLLAGLVVELAFAFILNKPPLEKYSTIAADILIAGGVWFELHFAGKAREEGDRIVADALDRAARAETALIEYRRDRRELLWGKRSLIVEKLLPFAGTQFDIGHGQVGFREQWDFLWVLEPAFIKAGWKFQDWVGGEVIIRRPEWPEPRATHMYGLVNALNVTIELALEKRAALLPASQALVDVLSELGISAAIERGIIASTSANVNAIHVLVGEKT